MSLCTVQATIQLHAYGMPVHVQDAPFFTVKLGIQTLPCTIFFRHGVVVGQVVGFDGLGGVDDFQTSALEDRMRAAEVGATQFVSATRMQTGCYIS